MVVSTLKNPHPAWYVAVITVLAGIGVLIWDELWKGLVLIGFGVSCALWALVRARRSTN